MADAIYDYQFRIVMIGDAKAGKTSIVRWFSERKNVNGKTKYRPTIGAEYTVRIVDAQPEKTDAGCSPAKLRLQIYDTAGQERFRAITKSYYKNSVGVVVVFDLTQRETFEHAEAWLEDCVLHTLPHRAVLTLIGTKADLVDPNDHQAITEDAEELAARNGMAYFETSAVNGQNIDEALTDMGRRIYARLSTGQLKPEFGWEAIRDHYSADRKVHLSASNRDHLSAHVKKFCQQQ